MKKQRFKIAFAILGIIFLLSRLYRVDRTPLFSDEAYAILQAERLRHGAPLLGMVKNTTQPVFIWLVALFQLLPTSLIVSSRMASATVGLLSAWMFAAFAGRWIHPKARWIAFLLAMVIPFSFFYDRTALFESTVSSAIALSLFFPIVGVPFAVLVKQTGWFALPLVFLTNRNMKALLLTIAATIVVPFSVWTLAYGSLAGLQNVLSRTSSAPISIKADVKSNLLRSKIWLRTYLTDPIIAMAFLGVIIELLTSIKKRTMTPLLGVAIWTGGIVLFESAIARIFYPRYLYPVVIGVVLLATRGVWTIVEILWYFARQEGSDLSKDRILPSFAFNLLVLPVLLFLLLLNSLRFDWLLMTNPSATPLALEDRYQFFEDWTSGVGSQELADDILKYQEDYPGKLTVYLEEENSYAVTLPIELEKRQIEIEIEIEIEIGEWLIDPLTDIPEEVRLKAPRVLFVRNRNPDIPADWPVEKIFSFNKTAVREVSLYRIL